MNDLECFDTEQLEAELKRRKEEEERQNKPHPVTDPDWSAVQQCCEDYIAGLFAKGYVYGDAKQYIFEAAMEAVFGKNVWYWVNARMRQSAKTGT